MKFGKQLQLGTYEPWKNYYIQYNKLKRIIRRRRFVMDKRKEMGTKGLSRSSSSLIQMVSFKSLESLPAAATASESTPLNTSQATETYTIEAEKAEEGIDFFSVINEEMEKINHFYLGKLAELRIALDEIMSSRKNLYRTHHTSGDSSHLLRLRDIYVELAALRSYCELNKTGFYKIIKKYDKVMEEISLEPWMKTVGIQDFAVSTDPVQLMDLVTGLVSRDKLIEWEKFATEQQAKSEDEVFSAVRPIELFISIFLYWASQYCPVVPEDDPCASRCLSLLVLAVSLWVTEAIPYYTTAILVPVLVITMGVLKDKDDQTQVMSPELAGPYVLNNIFNHTTMLLLGGYTISSAFSRVQLELRFASWLQEKLGHSPSLFILAVMLLGLFLSMWINNHTAPILCAGVILPIVRDLPTESRFSKALLLGLAYACNFGGMLTPISSLQNVLAVSTLEQVLGIEVSFGHWLLVSVPFSLLCTFLTWAFLLVSIRPNDIKAVPVIVYERDRPFGRRDMALTIMSLLAILSFAGFYYIKPIFGDIGIVSLCFVGFMFGSGLLSEVDFNSLSWHTLFLIGGGNVLGIAIKSSGLLEYLCDGITRALPLDNAWVAMMVIMFFTTAVSTFVSHTVASIILMPVIITIGATVGAPEVMAIGAAFAVSAAMGLPFSSFPNVNSLLILDDWQQPYLSVMDFLKTGMIITFFTVVLICTIGFFFIGLVIVGD